MRRELFSAPQPRFPPADPKPRSDPSRRGLVLPPCSDRSALALASTEERQRPRQIAGRSSPASTLVRGRVALCVHPPHLSAAQSKECAPARDYNATGRPLGRPLATQAEIEAATASIRDHPEFAGDEYCARNLARAALEVAEPVRPARDQRHRSYPGADRSPGRHGDLSQRHRAARRNPFRQMAHGLSGAPLQADFVAFTTAAQ
jgi:hypothetical protein